MGRRASEPLDKRKNLLLYKGDWERLEDLLFPTGIPIGVFLRQLVRKKILQLEAVKNEHSRPVHADASEFIESLELDSLERSEP
jgi:hypothetical protein